MSLANGKGPPYFWYLPKHPPFSITTLLFQIGFVQASSCQSTLKPGSYLNGFVFFLMLPWWFSSKESACSAGDARDVGSIPGLEWSPGVGNATLKKNKKTISDCDQGENVCLTKTHRHTHFKKPL